GAQFVLLPTDQQVFTNERQSIRPGLMQMVPTIPRDGTYLRERNSMQVYVIQKGKKVPMNLGSTAETCIVPDGSLNNIPAG
ncbi:MAG: hypothetical protein M3R61_05705, partial [Chloroflexota bacterium]|nr:hypothetical protein [Chloroflexota bacterium]